MWQRDLHRLMRVLAGALVLSVPVMAHAQPTTTRVSVGPGGTQGNGDTATIPVVSGHASVISADGRWVAFGSSSDNLVAGDTNGAWDVFVHDQQTAATTRASVGSGGAQGNYGSGSPAISADGRWVAFGSGASNLVSGDTNSFPDIFVRDRDLDTTTRVSVGPGGVQANRSSELPVISADGRWVAFQSDASNLVAGDTNDRMDVFVHDRQTGTTTRASVGSGDVQGNGESRFAVISGDGRWVAFFSNASNWVAGDWDDYDVFVHDQQTGTTTLVSVAHGSAGFPVINSDGRWVAFGGFVYDQQTGTTTPLPSGGAASAISADGRWVVFVSGATNLVPGDTNGADDVFVYDQQTRTTTRVSVDSAGIQGNDSSYGGSISADGRSVAFDSRASNLVAGDTNGRWDVFAHDRVDPRCTVALAPASASAPAAGATGSVQVTAPAMCAWIAASNDPTWLTVTGGSSGTGSGTVTYTAAANAGPPRTGSISIWGQLFTMHQAAAEPEAPTGLVAQSVVGNIVTLRWTIPSLGPVPTDFLLEGGLNPGEVLASLLTGSAAPTFSFAAPAGSFFVRMHALSGGLRSAASNEIRIHVNVPVAPSAPANLLALVDGSTLALAWTNTYAGGAPMALVLDVTGATTASVPMGLADSFSFAGVPAGTYTLSLRALNGVGASPSSNAVTVTFPGPCSGPPEVPTAVVAYGVGPTVFIDWAPGASGPAPTAYVLNVTGLVVGAFATSTRTLSGTVGPGSYTLSVYAANACGASASSPPQTVVVP